MLARSASFTYTDIRQILYTHPTPMR